MAAQESSRFERALPVELLACAAERRGLPRRVERHAEIDRRMTPCAPLLLVPAP